MSGAAERSISTAASRSAAGWAAEPPGARASVEFLDGQHIALRAFREAKGMRHARRQRDGARRLRLMLPALQRDFGRALGQEQDLEQAVVAMFGNLPAVAFAAAPDILDMDEFRRDRACLAIEGKYRNFRSDVLSQAR
ncbi:MAG: hypothetical protein V9G24_04115 [Rhodoblastus sp.]